MASPRVTHAQLSASAVFLGSSQINGVDIQTFSIKNTPDWQKKGHSTKFNQRRIECKLENVLRNIEISDSGKTHSHERT